MNVLLGYHVTVSIGNDWHKEIERIYPQEMQAAIWFSFHLKLKKWKRVSFIHSLMGLRLILASIHCFLYLFTYFFHSDRTSKSV